MNMAALAERRLDFLCLRLAVSGVLLAPPIGMIDVGPWI